MAKSTAKLDETLIEAELNLYDLAGHILMANHFGAALLDIYESHNSKYCLKFQMPDVFEIKQLRIQSLIHYAGISAQRLAFDSIIEKYPEAHADFTLPSSELFPIDVHTEHLYRYNLAAYLAALRMSTRDLTIDFETDLRLLSGELYETAFSILFEYRDTLPLFVEHLISTPITVQCIDAWFALHKF